MDFLQMKLQKMSFLGNFRSYSMYIAVDSVLNSVALDLIHVILFLIPVALDLIPVKWKTGVFSMKLEKMTL